MTLIPTDTYQSVCSCGCASAVHRHMKPALMEANWHDMERRLLARDGIRHTIITSPIYEEQA